MNTSKRNPFDIHFYYDNTDADVRSSLQIRYELETAFPWLNFHTAWMKVRDEIYKLYSIERKKEDSETYTH